MGQTILLNLQGLKFKRILQTGSLQILKELLLPLALPLELLAAGSSLAQSLIGLLPSAIGPTHLP